MESGPQLATWRSIDQRLRGVELSGRSARYYDPSIGQFLTVDPKVASTLSPYGYVQGNPLNGTDPSGEWGLPGWVTSAWNATGGQVGQLRSEPMSPQPLRG